MIDDRQENIDAWESEGGIGILHTSARETIAELKKLRSPLKLIDSEVKSIIDSCYERAEKLLKENLDKLNIMADALLKYETIGIEQIDDIMEGATPREPKGWSDDTPSGKSAKKSSIKSGKPERNKQILGTRAISAPNSCGGWSKFNDH